MHYKIHSIPRLHHPALYTTHNVKTVFFNHQYIVVHTYTGASTTMPVPETDFARMTITLLVE